jgi:hypothetical protein
MKRRRDNDDIPAVVRAKSAPAPAPWIGCTDLPDVPDTTTWMCLGGQELDGNRLFLAFSNRRHELMGITWQLPAGPVLSTVCRNFDGFLLFSRRWLVCSGVVALYDKGTYASYTARISPDLTITGVDDCVIAEHGMVCSIDYTTGRLQQRDMVAPHHRPRHKSLVLASDSRSLVRVPFVGLSPSLPWLHQPSGAVLLQPMEESTTLILRESDGATSVLATLLPSSANYTKCNNRCLTMTTGMVVVDKLRIRVFRELALRAAWVRCVLVCA